MHQQKCLSAKCFLLSASVVSSIGLLAILPHSALAQDMPESTPVPTTTAPLPTGTTPAATPSAVPEPTPAAEPVQTEDQMESVEIETPDSGAVVDSTEETGSESEVVTDPAEMDIEVGAETPAVPAATPISNPTTPTMTPTAAPTAAPVYSPAPAATPAPTTSAPVNTSPRALW